jgi:hypothetical protein
MNMHWVKVVPKKKTAKSTHIQMGRPQKVVRRCFFGSGLGNSDWQRQQTFLSSGFHVPQLGQSGMMTGLLDRLDVGAW